MTIVVDPLTPLADDGSKVWEQLYEALGYHRETDPATGYTLRQFCEGWCGTLQPVHDLVRERDDGPPWAILFDVDNCPAESLPYLAQYVGVVLTPEMSEADIRDAIREPVGWARGRLPAIKLAPKPTLSGTRRVIVRSRTPVPGAHYIRTLSSETPEVARTSARLRAAVPAWEVLDYEAITGVSWKDITAGFKDWAAVKAAFIDWADLADTLPTELPEP